MALNSVFSWFIKKRIHQIELFKKYPHEVQSELFHRMLHIARETEFGREHNFQSIRSFSDYQKAVPIRRYEDYEKYISKLRKGEQNVLWPTRLKWFAKSSGTTNHRSKFLPVSKEALEDCHYKGGKDLLAMYYDSYPEADVYGGKSLVLGGSSKINTFSKDSYSGDLSAIIIKNLPFWVELKRVPNREVALMDNWEEKIEVMARATMDEDVRMIAGVPSWSLVLMKRIMELKGASNMLEVWPNLELFMHGGVSFSPYRQQYERLIPSGKMHYLQNYNASEGFFGIQDRLVADDMLLMLDYGIFYEFLPMEELEKENPQALSLEEVEIGKNYALVISTNAGLWRYLIGDTVRFSSTDPYRIQVTGRTKHFINAFGEELIIENAESGLEVACEATGAVIKEFTAGPIYMDNNSTGGHEWLIEFEKEPNSMEVFRDTLDDKLKELNTDYEAKRSSDLTLRPPLVKAVPNGTFYDWLKRKNKLGGQHKVPRLANNRQYLDDVLSILPKPTDLV
ncbi:GH3 auxin-responsive promoter family protein [Halocola ammonii]